MHTLHKRVFLLVISTLFSLSGCSDSSVETESVDMDTEERLYTYRAIAGISMGGGASAHIALSNPDRYDFVGILGAPLGRPQSIRTYDSAQLDAGLLFT